MEQPPTLFLSKITLPRLRPARVERRSLIDQIESNLWTKLTLICAPAGFGKTTIVREWSQVTDWPVCYFLLDEEDNLPHNFLSYVIASIRMQFPNFGDSLQEMMMLPSLPAPDRVTAIFSDEFEKHSGQMVLVLDDYQVIHHDYIHTLVRELLIHLPEKIHVMIVTREEPPIPLALMRARNELYELRMNDLRFNREEITSFLNDLMKLDLNEEQVVQLLKRTEGWAVGIQLAALSIQEQPLRDGFIEEFTGSNRYILEFLMEEVLDRLDPVKREFLMRCSLLEKMNQKLCDAISADLVQPPSLIELEAQNLFTTSLDQNQEWFRFHPLFADSLRYKLQKEKGSDGIKQIYRQAAAWEAEAMLLPEAVHHYSLAGEYNLAGQVAEANAALLLGKGESTRCIEWLDNLPEEVSGSSLGIQLIYGYGLISNGQISRVGPHVARAQTIFDSISAYVDENLRQGLQARIFATQALLASETGDIEETIRLADLSLPCLPEEDPVRTSIMLGKAIAYHNIGQTHQALSVMEKVCAESIRPDQAQVHLVSLCNLADVYLEVGEFQKGYQTFMEAIQFAQSHLMDGEFIAGMAYHGLSLYFYEFSKLDKSSEMADKALPLTKKWGNLDVLCGILHVMVQIYLVRDDIKLARQYLDEEIEFLKSNEPQQATLDQLWVNRLNFALHNQNRDEVKIILAEINGKMKRNTPFLAEFLWLERAYAELWLDARLRPETEMKLREIEKAAVSERPCSRHLACLYLMVHRQKVYGTEILIEDVRSILSDFQRLGYFRSLADRMSVVHPLVSLADGPDDGVLHQYLQTILTDGRTEKVHPVQTTNLMALSEREIEVVRCLEKGLSNTEIAKRLFLSPGTVKRHLHNIFQKLGVDSRLAAVAQAKMDGYL